MTLITARTAAATAYRDIDRSAAAGRAAKAKAAADRSATTLATFLDLPQTVLDKRKKGAEALAQLEQAHQAGIAHRKGAAKQKLEAARAKLQMVRMFGGDPKAMARQAKRIAQEIREAAREYGAALQAEGGSAAGADGGAGPAETGKADTGVADAAGDKPDAGDAGQDPDASHKASAYQTAATDMAARSDKARAEREDIEKFKEGARDARRLIEEAIRRLKAQKAAARDIDELEGARRSMTEAVDDLDKASSDKAAAGQGALAEPAVPLAPMVDISV